MLSCAFLKGCWVAISEVEISLRSLRSESQASSGDDWEEAVQEANFTAFTSSGCLVWKAMESFQQKETLQCITQD